jgi:hypothetical protein
VARLAEVDHPLPPILVDVRTMRVIDGQHRLLAAQRTGQATIDAVLFDGSQADAFIQAVRANVTHGMPLSMADRRAAAVRIIASHPHLSDRAIAEVTGLGRTTVAGLRRGAPQDADQSGARLGKDGRVRPVNSADGRHRAAAIIAERPNLSLREVARVAGIALATASDVRRRMRQGLAPAPWTAHGGGKAENALPEITTVTMLHPGDVTDAQGERRVTAIVGPPDGMDARAGVQVAAPGRRIRRRRTAGLDDPGPLMVKLLRDPALRYSESGRQLLVLLRTNADAVQAWPDLVATLPPHCEELVFSLAEQYVHMWRGLAQELDERARTAS